MDNKQPQDNETDATQRFLRLMWNNDRRIFAFIVSLVPNLSDAEDIMQDTMALMWQKFAEFAPGTDFVAWGVKIAHFSIMNYRKKNARSKLQFNSEVMQLLEDESQTLTAQMDERIEALRDCIGKLPEAERKIIQMHYNENIKGKELSRRLGLPANRMYRGLCRIHAVLLTCVRRTLAKEIALD